MTRTPRPRAVRASTMEGDGAVRSTDWAAYATAYDMLLDHNPAYIDMQARALDAVERAALNDGATIADVGAGTGNASLAVAQRCPSARVLHIEPDEGMRRRAVTKGEERRIRNVTFMSLTVEELDFEDESLDAVVCLHALYTFPEPERALRAYARWLRPGGTAVIVDLGRVLDIGDWTRFFVGTLVRSVGPLGTAQVMWQGREILGQNRRIRDSQMDGSYWTHSHSEFLDSVSRAGLDVVEADTCFRGYSDFVVARRSGR